MEQKRKQKPRRPYPRIVHGGAHKQQPLELNKRWGRLGATQRLQATALGYTEELWEKNRLESLRNLGVNEEFEISFNGRMPHHRVKLMIGDPARSRLVDAKSCCNVGTRHLLHV